MTGERKQQIHHARLRNRYSNLNADLFYNHLNDTPYCECEATTEDAEHFFFKCPLFAEQRRALFIGTRSFHPLSAHKLLFGIEGRTDKDNSDLFLQVQHFIKSTKRLK